MKQLKQTDSRPLIFALSKGRIFEETLPLLASAGIVPAENPGTSRKLILDSNEPWLKFVIVRASDVPTYVQYAGADLGVVGKDILMEHGGEGVYEPLDLEIAKCRLMVAGFPNRTREQDRRLRIATKYVRCAQQYFADHLQQVEVIKLYGSMELAPLAGLADLIVDIVDTGKTLEANGLEPQEHIAHISSRLIVNRAAMKTHHSRLQGLIDKLSQAVIENRKKS